MGEGKGRKREKEKEREITRKKSTQEKLRKKYKEGERMEMVKNESVQCDVLEAH